MRALFQEALGVQSRHAARAGAGNGLAVNVVLHVSGSKNARHAGHRGKALQAAAGDDVAVFHVNLAGKNIGIRLVTDGNKAALERNVAGCAIGRAFETHARHTRGVAQHFV